MSSVLKLCQFREILILITVPLSNTHPEHATHYQLSYLYNVDDNIIYLH